jgi:arsenate reductase (thioredoxin)
MAEGFARAYGSDVIEPASAGLAPAFSIPLPTLKVMDEKNVPLNGQFPKGLDALSSAAFDTVVNMSGRKLPPGITATVEEWDVRDPIGEEEAVYREVRDQIEGLVMRLVLASRAERDTRSDPPPPRRKFLR